MADGESLVLEHPRHARAAVDDLRVDRREATARRGSLAAQCGELSVLLDRVGERVGRIERRLDLIEA
jgi:hypothetical protein